MDWPAVDLLQFGSDKAALAEITLSWPSYFHLAQFHRGAEPN